jgi:hypothetical protein
MAPLRAIRNFVTTFDFVLRYSQRRRRAMMTKTNVASVLRRDATYVGNAVGVMICVGFASLAVAAAVFDLVAVTR